MIKNSDIKVYLIKIFSVNPASGNVSKSNVSGLHHDIILPYVQLWLRSNSYVRHTTVKVSHENIFKGIYTTYLNNVANFYKFNKYMF